jgi:hypothetical protein
MSRFMRTSLIAILCIACMAPVSVQAEDSVGFVVYLKGTARIERGTQVINAAVKTPLLKGDLLRTDKQSYIKILFNDDTIITVSEKSKFSVDKYLYDSQRKQSQSLYRLIVGRLRVIVGRATLKVTTDTAIAGARGTVFDITYDPATGTTSLSVFEGTVELKNAKPGVKGMQLVPAGYGSSVSGNEPPKPPAPIAPMGKGPDAMLPPIEQPIAPVVVSDFVINMGNGSEAPQVNQGPPGYTKAGLRIVFP